MPITSYASVNISGAFGMNMHLRNRIAEANWDQAMSLADEAGVQWAREEFSWEVIEPTDDNYNWDEYDSVIDKYQENNIQVLGLITYSSSWASSNPGSSDYEYYMPDMTAWQDYVSNLAERYAGKVDTWEIWNEPNYEGFFKDDLEDYVDLVEASSDSIKTANPNAKIVLGGLSGADSDYLQSVYKEITNKDDFDIIALHPYRVIDGNFNYMPEKTWDGLNKLKVDLANVKAVANKNQDSKKPIWLTEMGWTTYSSGISEARQADYLLRGYAMALSVPRVKKVFWYNFRNDSDNTDYLESNFGLVDNDFSKKPAFDAFSFLKSKINNKKYLDSSLVNLDVLDNFNKTSGWEFSGAINADGTIKQNYNGTLRVYYKFLYEDNSYLPIKKEIKMPRNTKAISFKAKGNNDKTILRVRIKDRTGEMFQYNLGRLPNAYVTYRIDLDNYNSSWGGDADGKLDQPLKFHNFILDDNPDTANKKGYVYFDDLQSSKSKGTYIYHYKKGKKHSYLVWNTGKSKRRNIRFKSAKQLRVETISKSQLLTSSTKHFMVRVTKRLKYLYVKQ